MRVGVMAFTLQSRKLCRLADSQEGVCFPAKKREEIDKRQISDPKKQGHNRCLGITKQVKRTLISCFPYLRKQAEMLCLRVKPVQLIETQY